MILSLNPFLDILFLDNLVKSWLRSNEVPLLKYKIVYINPIYIVYVPSWITILQGKV